MKKTMSGILSLCFAAGIAASLSGCGKKDDGNTLVWYMQGDKPAAHEKVMAKANEIIEPALGMKLDMQYIDSASFTEKMKLKMASKESYDLTFTGYVNDYQTAVRMGGLLDITDLIKETGLDEYISDFYLESATVNGRIYGIPNIQVASNPADVEIQTSVAEECGIKDTLKKIEEKSHKDATMEELQEAAKLWDEVFEIVHEKRPDLYTWNSNAMLFSVPVYESVLGGTAIKKNGSSNEIVNLYKTDEWKLSAEKTCEWFEKGYIRSDIANVGDALSSVEERLKVAFVSSSWKPGQEAYQATQYGEPLLSTKLHAPYTSRTHTLSTMVSVGANTKHPKEAVELIKLINSNKELYNIICWGIEGETYKTNEDGTVSAIVGGGYEGVGLSAWKYGNQFNGFVQDGQPTDVWEQTEQMNEEADKSPMLGFVPDTAAIDTELANIANVEAEYKAKRMYGTSPMSEWYDEFIAKLEQAGIDKVIAELQSQYDAWREAK